MTAFVESCVETVTGQAVKVEKRTRRHPRARQLLRLLQDKKNILITTHEHPDPDALASSLALCLLLSARLPGAKVSVALKGNMGGGLNQTFAELINLKPVPWEETVLSAYDALVLIDTQPPFTNSPLPANTMPTAVIDHHRSRGGRRPKCGFCDIRSDVGATATIIFSYFMELEQPISRDLGAILLFAIESDLAGAAGQPGELDNMALASLTLIADTRKLYKMRYVDLPQDFYIAYARGLNNATYYDTAITSHIDEIHSPERPAIIADFLLRFDKAKWSLVTAVYGDSLVMSLRTNSSALSAADIMRRLVRHIGEGGGHRTKAGGNVKLASNTPAEIERLVAILRRRFLSALNIKGARGQRLVPPK
jgi:nanoRNase/pAp phosphatase (c-di-AMP/oligoRNAs hydrolase)